MQLASLLPRFDSSFFPKIKNMKLIGFHLFVPIIINCDYAKNITQICLRLVKGKKKTPEELRCSKGVFFPRLGSITAGQNDSYWIYQTKAPTCQSERCEVYRDVVLFAGQFAAVTLQVVSVTSIFSHPLHLVATVGLGYHLRNTALKILHKKGRRITGKYLQAIKLINWTV